MEEGAWVCAGHNCSPALMALSRLCFNTSLRTCGCVEGVGTASFFVGSPSHTRKPCPLRSHLLSALYACTQVHEVEGAGHTLFQPRKGRGSVPGSAGVEGVAGALENEPGRGEGAAGGEQGRAGTKALGKRKRGAGGQGAGEGSAEAPLGADISGGPGRKKVRVTGGEGGTEEGALVQAAVVSQGGGSVASSGDPKFDAVLNAAAAFCLSLA